jgi:RimJ/RimL family protein N-acetyltransferase
MIKIKKFNATNIEFKELARIDNLVNHDSIDHPDEDKDSWKIRDKSLIRDRLLLYKNEILVGAMYYSQGRDENIRTTFFTLNIDPDFNTQECRELLYNRMLKEIKLFNSNKIFTGVYDHPNYHLCQQFLIENNFKLLQTNREYSCDIRDINIEKYQPLIKKLELEGIKFYDSKEEMRTWPEHYKKLEELEWSYSQDFPIPEGVKHTRVPFEQFIKNQIDYEKNSYGIEIIAVKDGKYIGSTDLSIFPKSEPHKAWTEGLGVLKNFRREGIATALKIKAIERLLNKGVIEVRTDNEENNPMYKINVALGFKPVPFSLEYMKEI